MATLEERLAAAVAAQTKVESTPDWSDVAGQALENAPESAWQLATGIWEMISNPVDTAVSIGHLAQGVASKLIPGLELDETAADAFGEFIVDRYGGDEGDPFAGFRRTLANDPVGAIADLSGLFTGGSTAAAKAALMVNRVAQIAKAPRVANAASAASRGLDKAARVASYVDPVGLPFRAAGMGIKGLNRPDAKMLYKEGVSPTMGQILGGTANRLEESVATVPILGTALAAGRERAAGQFNRAAHNRALEPIGEAVDKKVTGSAAIDQVSDKLSLAYDNLLPKIKLIPDDMLLEDIARVVAEAKKTVGPEAANSLDKILRNSLDPHLLASIDVPMSGTKFKTVEETLGKLGKNFLGSANADQRIIGNTISDIQTSLRDALTRSNPQYATELSNINKGYANYVRLRNAGAKVASGENFTPSQFAAGVRASDKSLGKGDAARGRALMQDLSSAGTRVLGDKVRSSWTAERGAVLAAGTAAATGSIPLIDPMAAALWAGSAVPYLPGAQRGMAAALIGRPKVAGPIGNAVRQYGPLGGYAGYQATQPERKDIRTLDERLLRATSGAQ